MLSPPSLQKAHGICWSLDPALNQPEAPMEPSGDEEADKAAREAWAEYRRKVEQARELGDWTALIKPGEKPTIFELRPVSGKTLRRVADGVSFERLGPAEASAIMFRAALRGVSNFGEYIVELENDPIYGKLAKADILDRLDAIHPGIVTELGGYVWERASSPRPK